MVPEDKDSAYAVLCLLVDPINKDTDGDPLTKEEGRHFSGPKLLEVLLRSTAAGR